MCHYLPAAAHRHRADPPEQREAPTSKNPTSKNIHISHFKVDLYQLAAFPFQIFNGYFSSPSMTVKINYLRYVEMQMYM